jgi:EpsI family protein
VSADTFDLQQVVPWQFGEWTHDPRIRLVEPPADGLARQLYNQELGRAYRDREGNLVMLLVAYGPNQTSRLQLHRPELCYAADGFRVSKSTPVAVTYRDGGKPLDVLRLTARREARVEPISYWVRIGDDITNSVWGRQLSRLKLTFRNKVADGALMRVSTIGVAEDKSFEVQDRFIRDFYDALAPQNRAFFFGGDRTYAQAWRSTSQ